MPSRGSHYERAFERYLRDRRAPYVLLEDAKRVLTGRHARLPVPAFSTTESDRLSLSGVSVGNRKTLKDFDLVVFGEPLHALIDVKGRKVSSVLSPGRRPRLENWVTEDDVTSLRLWESLFGPGHEAAFVFVYWCPSRPPEEIFDDVFEHHGRWYGLRAVTLGEYRGAMQPRSARWRTVHLKQDAFERLSRPLFPGPLSLHPDAAVIS